MTTTTKTTLTISFDGDEVENFKKLIEAFKKHSTTVGFNNMGLSIDLNNLLNDIHKKLNS